MFIVIVVLIITILVIGLLFVAYTVRGSLELQNQIIWPASNNFKHTHRLSNVQGYIYNPATKITNLHIVYFHGNIEQVSAAKNRTTSLTEYAHLYLIEYPGYSNVCSLGKLEPETFLPCMSSVVREIFSKIHQEPNQKIILYGRSIGTGVIGEILVKDKYIAKLASTIILETPFTSIRDIFIEVVGPAVTNLLGDKMHWTLDNVKNFSSFMGKDSECKILIIAGEKDTLTPVTQAKKLTSSLGDSATLVIKENQIHNMSFSLILGDVIKFLNYE